MAHAQCPIDAAHGDAVIIVNIGSKEGYSPDFVYRKGAEQEKKNLEHVFIKRFMFRYLNKDVLNGDISLVRWNHALASNEPGHNCNGKCIMCLIEKKVNSNAPYFMLALTSHGFTSKGELYISMSGDNSCLPFKEVITALKACKKLAGKIVIIIVEACRHTAGGIDTDPSDKGVTPTTKAAPASATSSSCGSTGSNVLHSEPEPDADSYRRFSLKRELPEDFLIVYGTTPYRYSYRHEKQGSWLEDALRQEVEKNVEAKQTKVNFLDLLTQTANNVAGRETEAVSAGNVVRDDMATPGSKCVIEVEHSLTRQITFDLNLDSFVPVV